MKTADKPDGYELAWSWMEERRRLAKEEAKTELMIPDWAHVS